MDLMDVLFENYQNPDSSQPEQEEQSEVESDNENEAETWNEEATGTGTGTGNDSDNHQPDTTARRELLNPDEYEFFISFRPKDSNG